ncbi:MAG TPA: AMP-binding protein [Kofleriaceae bacterium]|nr:AMP-binding protein [Kofleriaceae bacterium]
MPPTAMLLDEDAVSAARDRVLAAMRARRVAAGDRVAVLCGTRPEMVAAREAASAAEVALVPLDPRLAPPEIAFILAHARPALVLVEEGHGAAADAAVERLLPIRRPAMVALESVPAAARGGHAATGRRGGTPSPATIGATLLYTSGTTGRPRGCMRPAEVEAARAAEIIATYGVGPDDVHLVACPLAYSAPGIFLRAARAAGAATALMPRFTADGFLEAVRDLGATFFFLVPTQLERILALPPDARRAEDLASVRAVVVAGAPFAPALRRAAVDWLGPGRLWEFYGSSETGTITVLRPEEQLAHAESVGRAAPGVELRLVPRADAAEIAVRSPTVMSGYWNPITMTVEWPGTEDRFLSVGDLGELDAGGYLRLIDRLHDTIISGGVNIYPAEVERALAEHPLIESAVVFGVADSEWGQRVAAVVAARTGAALDGEALCSHLRGRIASHKIPRQIVFVRVDEIPRTSSGKPLRRAAAALLRRGKG